MILNSKQKAIEVIDETIDLQKTYEWEWSYPPCPFDDEAIKNIYDLIDLVPLSILDTLSLGMGEDISATPYGTFVIVFRFLDKELTVEVGNKELTYYETLYDNSFTKACVNEKSLKKLVDTLKTFYIS